MSVLIDIETSAGARQGAGPIRSAGGWRMVRRLDRAGEFSFVMPSSDARADYVRAKRVARAYALVNGSRSDRGAGVIDECSLSAIERTLRVSGMDLLRELTYRTVEDLSLWTWTWYTADNVRHLQNAVVTELPLAFDGNLATWSTIDLNPGTGFPPYIYLRSLAPASAAAWYFGTNPNTAAVTTPRAQYFGDTGGGVLGWKTLALTGDTTIIGATSWAQDGVMTWNQPADEVMCRAFVDQDPAYYYRFTTDGGAITTNIDWAEVQLYTYGPTTSDLSGIIALAPAGWAIDPAGYASTALGTYAQFDYDTVLGALSLIAQSSGEHFRLNPIGRSVTWLRGVPEYRIVHSATAGAWTMGEQITGGTSAAAGTVQYIDAGTNTIGVCLTTSAQFAAAETITGAWSGKTATVSTSTSASASGVRAVRAVGDPAKLQSNTLVCLITRLTESADTYDYNVTRVYPCGSGNGADTRLTLARTQRTAPAGYTLSTADNYIAVNPEPSPRIDRVAYFPDIAAAEYPSGDVGAANRLFDTALTWLKRHQREYRAYDLEVTKLDSQVLPGQTIRVVYREVVDGYTAVDIDADMVVLETTEEIDNAGNSRVVAMKVATMDRWPEGDEDATVQLLQSGTVYQMHAQSGSKSLAALNVSPDG